MLISMVVAMVVQDVTAVPREAFIAAVDKRFVGIDADGDGALDTAELDAAQQRIVARIEEQRRNIAQANFAAADANGDGNVTLEEWIAAASRAPLRVWTGSQLLTSLDTDGDGRVSLDEYRASQLDHFEARDTDGDGTIEAGEH
ncbi:EF-hand domain-containing protein [Sphingomicrobium clamense]|uniref:EF-hand domain-containing protein n=1 Tax=Sphingomicrobium clamense TaxID=2851013 RepID=A0ABS6V3B4_9SPHN|nr:EF-hand domain-containing protein [Sphingomicrobium sp. B8]MBW0144042.1 EF-hand domain-containing protein [Sphingomicrobium sp. B8]